VDKNKVAQAADIEKEKIKASKPLSQQNPSVQGATVNEVDKKNPAPAGNAGKPGGTATGGGAGGTTGGTGGGTAKPPSSTGNAALDSIVGNPESLRMFQGLDPDSPEPAMPATAEGVPLQEWDFFGLGYNLLFQETGAGPAELASESQIEEMVKLGQWQPTNPADFRSALLGNRSMPGTSFADLLFALSLLPSGAMKTLNIVAHATSIIELSFNSVDFIFTRSGGAIDYETANSPEADPLSRLQLSELLALVGDAPIATPSGSVKLAEVRRAFAADAEVRVFNLSNPLREEYLQALANLFQTRVSGFVQKPVRMTAEVIAVSDEASERVLSRKVDLGFVGDPVDHPVGAFVHLLQRDHPARGGLYTAFPLRA
jgi:hypothetical protein